MKHLILWGTLIGIGTLLFVMYDKITVMTIFRTETSPIYVDIIFFLCGLSLIVFRGIAIVKKIF